MPRLRFLLLAALLCLGAAARAEIAVVDDSKHVVSLKAPARRIVSLAPHATELLFALGAGNRITGVIEYSNFPPEAQRIPTVGSATAIDVERIVAMKPDLVVIWGSGNLAGQVAKLRSLGIPVYDCEPHDFEAIASSFERLAKLTATESAGNPLAAGFRARLAALAERYRARAPVTVFYQIWREPLMTLNDVHMASAVIRLCGGKNIFGNLQPIAPTVSVEAVLKADPQAILAGTGAKDDPFSTWRRFSKMTAVADGHLISIDSDLLTRPGPRILEGTEALCKRLDGVRAKNQ
ncbi:MAG TPA: cobalamin-binding protein [Paucimonas sp.]|nr:cobalamin-binding protein [Paucimonas sp.]